MSPVVSLPDPTVAMPLRDLARLQNLAHRQITFSLTLSCPLRCAHCIVDASPERSATTMPFEVAEHYAAQMADLARDGVDYISFTGGEPLVARRQMRVLSDSAGSVGIRSGLVTAGHWGRTPAMAARTVASLPSVDFWDVSVDVFHERYVPHDHIRNCHDALADAGRQMTVRFAYHHPPGPDDRRVLDFVATLPHAKLACQRVRAVGRGKDLGIKSGDEYNPMLKPCLTQGMVVRYDGSVAPCCLNLVEERRHPFQYGTAFERPLTEVRRDYLADPLLQLIRAVGFADVLRWLSEAGLDGGTGALPDEVCEVCEIVMKDAHTASYLADRAAEPSTSLKIAVIVWKSLGEATMLRTLLDRFRDRRTSVAGYDDAEAFLAAIAGTTP